MRTIAIGSALVAGATGVVGCGSDDTGPLADVDALIILQRSKRTEAGDIFEYTSYIPGARLVKLSPPTSGGKLETICCDQDPAFAQVDISGYDISFDAKQIVFAGKLNGNSKYGLFLLNLETRAIDQIPTDPQRDYVSPIFLPGDRIAFTTNAVVAGLPGELTPRQHEDEYERRTTLQLGRINLDGSQEERGARNLSHRTFPTLASDGRIMFTQWDHLGRENSGHLMFVNQDLQELREGYGKEGKGAANSELKAREISPGRFVAIATSRDRTLQAGALIDIRLGTVVTENGIVSAADKASEANSTYKALTPDVPRDREPSAATVGRYYDATALNAKDKPDLLVSWADGPVEASVLASAGIAANFGVYLYNSARQTRQPILDDPEMWDIFARPLQTRSAPPIVGSATDPQLNGQMLVGSMNVYDSSLNTFEPGSIHRVRVIEGFSTEEGFREMFGTTEFEGQAQVAVADVRSDGSWLATVPANVPLALQVLDKFGMSLRAESVWFSGRPGEARMCGGCHERRTETTVINPGQTKAALFGPTPGMGLTPRSAREMNPADYARIDLLTPNGQGGVDGLDRLVGMAWDKSIQPIFDDAGCTTCHNGVKGPANPTYVISTRDGTASVEWTFDLRGIKKPLVIGGTDLAGEWTASYFSIAGPDMQAIEMGDLVVSAEFKVYAKPQDARGSLLIEKLNPPQLFPQPNTGVRFKPGVTPHATVGGRDLTATEFYKLIMMADMGVNFFARENRLNVPAAQ